MKPSNAVRGSLASIMRNDDGLYAGNLVPYFQAVFNNAQNLNHPYHNFRHMFHVVWLCYQACIFYKKELSPRQMRNLLLAAMFHDFDHSGMTGGDDLNVLRALRGLEKYIQTEDRAHLTDISQLIRATEYPHIVHSRSPGLSSQIIRDADLSQGFSVAWIQQVIFGLAGEWNQKPIDVLQKQLEFLEKLEYHTTWAQQFFSLEDVESKKAEIHELLDLLQLNSAVAA
ncbi:MAG: hypothetical protein AAB365_01955 [Patescibacteria group bacterium]